MRLRVRVGPGIAVDARATDLADAYAGTYFSVWAGLPGPRMRRIPKLPGGIETRTGVEASVIDETLQLPFAEMERRLARVMRSDLPPESR